ncbi:hypothetical protein B0H63DRAFT_474440 [Podospora didyma]|uniref:Uncharacterized protein n=1 Tax=Podospora didyma TaxID=330526 RepID=A0AAE0NG39_9PEZI|nr:hypothetical protein B0H63DRAFT_474440 [Podospora didyma]
MTPTELSDLIQNSTFPSPNNDTTPQDQDWDPYTLTSSFYGPGAFLCWYLVSISYTIKWATAWRASNTRPAHFPLTSDFIAMLAYPTIAAGDTIIRATTQFPPSEKHLLMSTMTLFRVFSNASEFATTRGINITTDLAADMDTLQHVVSVAAPLRICEDFFWPSLMMAMLAVLNDGPYGGPFIRSKIPLVDMTFVAVSVVNLSAIFVVAGVGWPGRMGYYEGLAFVSQYLGYVIIAAPIGMPVWLAVQLVKYWSEDLWDIFTDCSPMAVFLSSLFVVFGLTTVATFFIPFVVIGMWPREILWLLATSLVPDVGASMGELDQAAAACAGVITLGLTLYEASKVIPEVKAVVERWKVLVGISSAVREEDEVALTEGLLLEEGRNSESNNEL